MANYNLKPGNQLSPKSILIWRIVQTLVWLVGVTIIFNLFFYPTLGIHLFWNFLIPIAPLLLVLKRFIQERILIAVFSAAAVSCYYWFRLPALFGWGFFPGDGMLVDLTGVLPEWAITVMVVVLTLFFFWWIVFSKQLKISWVIRPAYAMEGTNLGKYVYDKNKG